MGTCEVGGHRGAAGHVILRYPSGGSLLVSAGHWVELSHIGVTEDRLLEVAAASYGQAYSEQVRNQFASCTTQVERTNLVQSVASQYVMQSPACTSCCMNVRWKNLQQHGANLYSEWHHAL